jgi:hypothetical protein
MHEYTINLHMHTTYSDGFGSHAEIARAAIKTGIDAVIITDHNVLVKGFDGYFKQGDQQVLVIVGQEVHDQARQPQKNHMLAIGVDRDVATYAYDPQLLINNIRTAGGLSFIAHPIDPAAPAIKQDDLGWVDWDIEGFAGLEIWNGLSELKTRIKTLLHGLWYLHARQLVARAPFPEALKKWDELLANGKRVVGIGGSDAHAIPFRLGPLRYTVFPYTFHFRCINTHILTSEPLTGSAEIDRDRLLAALGSGHAFVGYDLPAPTKGFRFTAQVKDGTLWMGDEAQAREGATLQIHLPSAAPCCLLRNGKVVKTWEKRQNCTYITNEPGVYRVEVTYPYLGKQRGWIYSNPIYLR